jgi:hypothetical protein
MGGQAVAGARVRLAAQNPALAERDSGLEITPDVAALQDAPRGAERNPSEQPYAKDDHQRERRDEWVPKNICTPVRIFCTGEKFQRNQ